MNNLMIDYILFLFPTHFRSVIKNYFDIHSGITEIRLRINGQLSFTQSHKNIITSLKVTRSDIDYIINKITDNNLLLCEPLIRSGYIPLRYDIRAGVGGDALNIDGTIRSIRSISYINLRIPVMYTVDCNDIINYIYHKSYSVSLIILSAPGYGKTTLLRSIAKHLSSPEHSRRVSIIDTNREFSSLSLISSLSDIFSGYPKADGINIATRYFNPQYIICDELGSSHETEAVCQALNAGVPVIASAHARDVTDARKRKNIAYLIEHHVFDAAITIERTENEYVYKITELNT